MIGCVSGGLQVLPLSPQPTKQRTGKNGRVSLFYIPSWPPKAFSFHRIDQLHSSLNPWTVTLLSRCSQSYRSLALEGTWKKWSGKLIGIKVINSRPTSVCGHMRLDHFCPVNLIFFLPPAGITTLAFPIPYGRYEDQTRW